MNVLSEEPIEDDSWVHLSAPTFTDSISDAIAFILKADEIINQHVSLYFGREGYLTNDCEQVRESLKVLNGIKTLEPAERESLVALVAPAIRALDTLKNNKALDRDTRNLVVEWCSNLKALYLGQGIELEHVRSFLAVTQQLIYETNPEKWLLNLSKETFQIVDSKKVQQELVDRNLKDVVAYLKKKEISKHLTVVELFQLKVGVYWLLANYVREQKSQLDLTESIYAKLLQINSIINEILKSRKVDEFANVGDKFCIASLATLVEHLSTTFYFKDFWADSQHVNELKQYEMCCCALNQFIHDNDTDDISGLGYKIRDDEAGLALYQMNSQDEKATPILIVFSYNKDSQLSYYNCFQDRKCHLKLGGLGHQPVYEKAEKSWENLQNLINESEFDGKNVHLITVGFGLDGAIAELLSYFWAVNHSEMQTRSYGLGVSPFLDVNAAGTVERQSNHYSINFRLFGDTLLKTSPYNLFAKDYSENNYNAIYDLYNRDWFLTDILGHDKDLYLENMQQGIRVPLQMYDLYLEMKKILEIKALHASNDVGIQLHRFMQQENKS